MSDLAHSLGRLDAEAVPNGCGYSHPYVIRCACGWRVRGLDVLAVEDAALDHVTGRTETPTAPLLDLDADPAR